MFAKLIVIEGPDKSGKATQSFLLNHALKRYGDKCKLVEVPFNDKLTHPIVYWMLKNGLAKDFPNLFQVFQFLNKFMFQYTVLLYLMLINDYIVLDRWSLSAVVYGDATGVNPLFSRILYSLLRKPYLTIILNGVTYNRNSVDDSFEKDSDLQKKVKEGYYNWSKNNFKNTVIIDNKNDQDTIHNQILEKIKQHDRI